MPAGFDVRLTRDRLFGLFFGLVGGGAPFKVPPVFNRRSRFRLLLACAAAPVCFGGALPTPAGSAPVASGDVSMEGTLDYVHDSGVIVAVPDERGNPVLMTSGARLEAGRILYDKRNRAVSADSGVKVDFHRLRILSDKVDYSASLRRLDTGRVRFGASATLTAPCR